MGKFSIVVILLFVSSTPWSAELQTGKDLWQCSAVDSDNKQWVVNSQYELAAINRAFDACKKQSRLPRSCKMSQENCTAIVRGVSSRPMWQCVALDQSAKHWLGNFYNHHDDAALGAKAFCKQHSSMPDTCYVNLITCKNRNQPSQ